MKVMLAMPVQIYHGLLGRCTLLSREYAVLRNSVIEHLPDDTVEVLCDVSDARLILVHAQTFYPEASRYIEEGLSYRAAGEDSGSHGLALATKAKAYRKSPTADTWHFCSNCSQWPTADYLTVDAPPEHVAVCNECIVRHEQANCRD